MNVKDQFNKNLETYICSQRRRNICSIIRINKHGVHRPYRCRQFRGCRTPHDGGKMKILSRAEELVLLSVWHLQENAYGVTVRKHIIKTTKQDWSIGAIYVPLDRLTKWGYLEAIDGEPTAERGGRRKRYYKLSDLGLEALKHLKQVQESMWASLPEFEFNKR